MGYKLEQKEYPINTQLRNQSTGEPIGAFYSKDEIRDYLSESTQRLVYCEDYCTFIKDAEYIFTPEISDLLSRYQMQENGYISYSKLYDDLPARWIEIIRVIKGTMVDAMKEQARRSKDG